MPQKQAQTGLKPLTQKHREKKEWFSLVGLRSELQTGQLEPQVMPYHSGGKKKERLIFLGVMGVPYEETIIYN